MLVYHIPNDSKKTNLLFRILSPHILTAAGAGDLKKWYRTYILKAIVHKVKPSFQILLSHLSNDALSLAQSLKLTSSPEATLASNAPMSPSKMADTIMSQDHTVIPPTLPKVDMEI